MKKKNQFDLAGKQAFLFQGLPGAGKTTLALQFPRPYLIDADDNLAGAIQGELLKDIDFNWDTPHFSEDGKRLENPVDVEKRLLALLDEAFNDDSTDTVILDSATAVTNIFVNSILKKNNTLKMEIQHWQPFIGSWIALVSKAKSLSKRFILIGHEEMVKDEIDGGLKRMLLLPSKARATIPGMFPDVWEIYVEMKTVGGNTTHKHLVRTKADNRVAGLKASNPGAGGSFAATWDEVKKGVNLANA